MDTQQHILTADHYRTLPVRASETPQESKLSFLLQMHEQLGDSFGCPRFVTPELLLEIASSLYDLPDDSPDSRTLAKIAIEVLHDAAFKHEKAAQRLCIQALETSDPFHNAQESPTAAAHRKACALRILGISVLDNETLATYALRRTVRHLNDPNEAVREASAEAIGYIIDKNASLADKPLLSNLLTYISTASSTEGSETAATALVSVTNALAENEIMDLDDCIALRKTAKKLDRRDPTAAKMLRDIHMENKAYVTPVRRGKQTQPPAMNNGPWLH